MTDIYGPAEAIWGRAISTYKGCVCSSHALLTTNVCPPPPLSVLRPRCSWLRSSLSGSQDDQP